MTCVYMCVCVWACTCVSVCGYCVSVQVPVEARRIRPPTTGVAETLYEFWGLNSYSADTPNPESSLQTQEFLLITKLTSSNALVCGM